MWSNAQQSYSIVDSPWRLPDSVLSKELQEEVWCAIAPVFRGIQRTQSEILDSKLQPLKDFRRACLFYLEPRFIDFRKSERFEYVARKLLNLTLIPDPDPSLSPALENSFIDHALNILPKLDTEEKEATVVNTYETKGCSKDSESYTRPDKYEEDSVSSVLSSEQEKRSACDFRTLPLGRRMLIYKPMPWTLKRPEKGDAVELSRKTGKKDHQRPKRGNIVGKEVWVTLNIGMNELGRHKNCGVVLHTDQRCSRVHGVVSCGV